MSSDLARWLTATPGERQHERDLTAVARQGEITDQRVRMTGHVTQHAMVQTARVNLIRQEAERLAPDAAELFAMIAVAGAVEMADIIAQMNRRGRR
jgi:hypothetical protein